MTKSEIEEKILNQLTKYELGIKSPTIFFRIFQKRYFRADKRLL